MSMFQIKILAAALMVIDHIGAFLFPDIYVLRMVGRISFILFAWLIANGAIYTKNNRSYLERLLAFGCISQIPYTLIMRLIVPEFWELNIFFTLAFGLITILAVKKFQRPPITIPLVLLGVFMIEQLIGRVTYGVYGVLVIVLCYLFYRNIRLLLFSQTLAIAVFYLLPLYVSGKTLTTLFETHSVSLVQPLGLLAIPIIASYNGQLGPKMKWAFYAFYPIHFVVLYVVHRIMY